MSNRLNHTIITHHHHHHLRRLRMRRRRKGRSRVPSVDIFRWFISIQWRLIYEGTLPMMISKSRPGRGKGSRRRGRCRRLYLSNSLRSHDIVRRARFLWSIEYINQRRLIRFILRIIGLFFVHCFVGCGFRGQISLFVYFFWSLLRAWNLVLQRTDASALALAAFSESIQFLRASVCVFLKHVCCQYTSSLALASSSSSS